MSDALTIAATFVMEQHIGHRTYYENLRTIIDPLECVQARWAEVTYEHPHSFWAEWPFLPASLRGILAGRAQVRQALHGHPADVTVFNTQVPAALGGRLAQRKPYILCTDITPLQYDRMGAHYGHVPDGRGPLGLYKHLVNCNLFRGAARVLPWSSWVQRSLIANYGVDADRVEVLAPGVDTDVWRPGPARDERRPVRALFVGGDFQRKGGSELLQAFAMLPTGTLELVVVTRSPVPPAAGVTVYDNMQPNSPELVALYQSCDFFVLPTRAEAFGIAAVEASAVGLPVIASAVGGVPDIVVDGKTGFLVSSGDTVALARSLHVLATDPALRRRYSRAARARVLSRFDAHSNAVRLVQLLRDVAAQDIDHSIDSHRRQP